MNNKPAKVVFLKNDGEIFAFFPNDYNCLDGSLRGCYAHIGQHSECHIDYANESRQATPEEYKDLLNELEGLGYNLQIFNKPKKFL